MVVMDYVGDEELDDVWPDLTPEAKEKYTTEVQGLCTLLGMFMATSTGQML